MTGWYYAAQMAEAAPRIRRPFVRSEDASPNPVVESAPACLGYGPDGRPRLAQPSSRISFLA